MTTEIVRVEANATDGHLGLMRMLRRVRLRELVLLQHVQQRGLARIVETEEDDVGALLEESEPLEARLEEIVDCLHFGDVLCGF